VVRWIVDIVVAGILIVAVLVACDRVPSIGPLGGGEPTATTQAGVVLPSPTPPAAYPNPTVVAPAPATPGGYPGPYPSPSLATPAPSTGYPYPYPSPVSQSPIGR